MLKKLFSIVIAIVKQLAIAFFFVTLIVLIVSPFLNNQAKRAFSLINNFTTEGQIGEEVEVKFDSLKKRLANYPPYGTFWATLKIPDINLEERVIHGDDLDLIKVNVGHYVGSYFPGEGGYIILAAHNSRKNFGKLPNLKIGAEVTIETDYGIFKYKVYDATIIKDSEEERLLVDNGKETLVMYTCYPISSIGFKDERYVVYAELISTEYTGDNNE